MTCSCIQAALYPRLPEFQFCLNNFKSNMMQPQTSTVRRSAVPRLLCTESNSLITFEAAAPHAGKSVRKLMQPKQQATMQTRYFLYS